MPPLLTLASRIRFVRGLAFGSALALAMWACTSANKGGRNGSVRAVAPTQDATSYPSPPAPSPGDYVPGQQPVTVTGSGLVDFDNARIRCDYKNTTAAQVYDAQCAVVAHQQTGQELLAKSVTSGVTLTWQPPATLRGDMSFTDCKPSSNNLNFLCSVTVSNPEKLAEVGFGLKVAASGKSTRIEPSTLLLPYSVSMAAGFVPSMPYQYKQQSLDLTLGLAPSPSGVSEAGFQHFGFDANSSPFPFPQGICKRADRLFFADQFAVYQVQNGKITHYAGSASSQNLNNTSDKLRTFLRPAYLTCTTDAVYVGSSEVGRIFKLSDSGSVQILADNGVSANPPTDAASTAKLSFRGMHGMAVDSAGSVLFADPEAHKVFYVTAAGKLGTFAGNGSAGYSGDGGPATAASLNAPLGVAIGIDGSVYIADTAAATVRKVAIGGIITTFAGTGVQRYASLANNPAALSEPQQVMVDTAGAVYVSEMFRGIKKILPNGTFQQVVSGGQEINQSARDMRLNVQNALNAGQPLPSYANDVLQRTEFSTVALDASGNFYTEGPVGVVAYMAAKYGVPVLVAGAPNSVPADCAAPTSAFLLHLAEASAIAIAKDNSILVADWQTPSSNQLMIHSIYPTANGNMAKGLFGCKGEAQLTGRNPTSLIPSVNSIGTMAIDKAGAIYLSNSTLNTILKMNPDGSMTNVAGNGTSAFSRDGSVAASSPIQTPIGLTLGADGSIYFVEYPFLAEATKFDPPSRIRRILPTGVLATVAGTGAPGDAGDMVPAASAPLRATQIVAAADGRLFVADYGNAKIKMIDAQGLIHTIAGVGIPMQNGQPQPGALVPNPAQAVDALRAQIWSPASIAVTNDGTVYYVDFYTNQVMQLKQRADGAWDLSVLFGVKRTTDCGTATIQSSAGAANVNAAIKSSLTVICEGLPRTVAIRDTCPAAGGETRIAITQSVDSYSNIIQIVNPCGT